MPEQDRQNLPASRRQDRVDKSQGQQSSRQSDDDHPDTTWTLEGLRDASAEDWLGSDRNPDVMLSVPNLGIDHIGLKVKDLRAHVDLHAKVLDLLELNVGADVSLEEIDLDIDNVRVQAMLKVQLDQVANIVDRVMETIDNNPEILTNLTAGIGKGVEGALSQGNSGSQDGDGDSDRKGIESKRNVSYDQNSSSSQPEENGSERHSDGSGSGSGPAEPERPRQQRRPREPRGRR